MSLDLTRPLQLRDGRKAELVRSDLKGPYPILIIRTTDDGDGEYQFPLCYPLSGRMNPVREEAQDLVNVEP